MIHIDAIWLATEPLDMRAGTDTILARVVKVFSAARPHHAYLFANRHSTRMKVLIYDGFGIWLAARRLNKGRFVWTNDEQTIATALNPEQLRALVTRLLGRRWFTITRSRSCNTPRAVNCLLPSRVGFWQTACMDLPADLDTLSPDELRTLAARLMSQVGENERELHYRQTRIEQLAHEIAVLKRMQFGRRSEQTSSEQMSLLNEAIDADLAALEIELEQLRPTPRTDDERQKPKRATCRPVSRVQTSITSPQTPGVSCGCERERIGEDVSENLDYTPGVFTVERHIRGKWVCRTCETLVQAPVPPHVIDKGIPSAGLLAQVLVAKYGDHLPLYRQERIFGRAAWRSRNRHWVNGLVFAG